MDIIKPLLTDYEITLKSTLLIFLSAVQLYFISTVLSLLFVGIPIFHMDRTSQPLKVRWARAMKDWRKLLKCKLDNYIEYQINTIQVVYITITSGFLFLIDASYAGARAFSIIIYTIILPLIYFYFKEVPEQNIEEVNIDSKNDLRIPAPTD
jgi:Na+/H+ antiporter NhaC